MTLLPSSTTDWEATLPIQLLRLMLMLRSSPRSPPCPTLWLSPLTPTSLPPLPPTSPPQLSELTTLLSPSSRESQLMEPRPSADLSGPTRLSTSQLFTKPAPTPSRLFPRLLLPQSMVFLMFQLLLMLPPQLPMLLMLLPQLPMLLMLLPQLPTLLMLLSQLLLDMLAILVMLLVLDMLVMDMPVTDMLFKQ